MDNSILERNIDSIYPSKNFLEKVLESGRKLRMYIGIDPTSPEIHIGNVIALRKLREFQNLGHKIILLVGDFTGMVGDPSDKSAMRPRLTKEQVLDNSNQYKNQSEKILNFAGKNPAEIKYNSSWLSKLSFEEILSLAGGFTVQQLLERDMFQKRLKEQKPIGLHEFLYPLMQGYDSVALDVDVEVGGTDQTFNMLVGRTLLKTMRGKEKIVITLPLLEGTDGRKMSKSYKNTIGVTDSPNEMYGKVMSLKDELIVKYFELVTDISESQLSEISQNLKDGENPMNYKKQLAFEITKMFCGEGEAEKAEKEFTKVFQKGERPTDPEEVSLSRSILPISFAKLASESGVTTSVSAGINLSKNKGLKVDGKVVENPLEVFEKPNGSETRVDAGKRKSVKITWK